MSAAAFASEVRLAGHGAIRLGAGSRHVLDAPGRPALVLVTLAGATAAGVSVASALTGGRLAAPGVQAALMAWVTLAYVLSGAVAWWRRPGTALGPLMIAAGFGMFLSSLSTAGPPVLYTVGIAFDLLAAVLFVHVFLAFPGGRLTATVQRALVGAGYATAFGLQLVGMTLGGFGPDNLLAVADAAHAASTLLRVQLLLLSALALAAIGLLVVRRGDPARPMRRSLALLVQSFVIALAMLAFLYASAALGLVSGQPVFEAIRRTTLFAIGLAPVAFLLGLLDARLARSAVGDLFVELRGNLTSTELGAALARTLGDPSLTLAHWRPERESWVDDGGRPVALPDGDGAGAATLVKRNGHPVAALLHDASLREEPELLDAVVAAVAIALENEQLHAESETRLAELQASRQRIVAAGDAERRRIERDLHDGAQQRLVALALQLRLAHAHIRRDPAAAEELVTTATDQLRQSLEELRELARGIHPAVLEYGLPAALESLATYSAARTVVSCDVAGRLPRPVELALYFVACEALANVGKYARATAVSLGLWCDGTVVAVEIADDGVGGADASAGSGLRGLADRVEALDGVLLVSSPPGEGTVIRAELPCAS